MVKLSHAAMLIVGLSLISVFANWSSRTMARKTDVSLERNDAMEYTAGAQIASQEEKDAFENNKKYLVVHVGPHKTASTFLQKSSREFLKPEDNYIYVGKGAIERSKLYSFFKDFACRDKVQEAANAAAINNSDVSLPPCFDTFTNSMKKFGNLNVLISSEAFFIPDTKSTPAWWQAIEDTAAQLGYTVVVAVVYRRLYEWLPSAYTQSNRGNQNPRFQTWPDEDRNTKRVEHPYPLFLQSQYVDRENGTKLWFEWTASYLEALPKNTNDESSIQTRVLNMHSPHSMQTQFFCNTVPAAHATCATSLALEEEADGEEARVNPSTPVSFDALALAAADAGLIDTRRFQRRYVWKAAEEYNTNELNRTALDFPMSCPPQDAYEKLLEASLYWEKQIVPEMNDEEAHRAGFWAAVEKKKYCWVDEEATLQLDEWKAFFQRYASSGPIENE